MIVSINQLVGEYSFPAIVLHPMNFKQFVQYIDPANKPSTKVASYMKDLELILNDDPNCYDLRIYDADYVIFRKKLASVTSKSIATITTTCPDCGAQIRTRISADDIKFRKLEDLPKSIVLSGKEYELEIPTVREFLLKTSNIISSDKSDIGIEIVKLMTLFKEREMSKVINIVNNATHEDIIKLMDLLEYTDSTLPIPVECSCKKEKGGNTVVSVSSLITDMFLDLYSNSIA